MERWITADLGSPLGKCVWGGNAIHVFSTLIKFETFNFQFFLGDIVYTVTPCHRLHSYIWSQKSQHIQSTGAEPYSGQIIFLVMVYHLPRKPEKMKAWWNFGLKLWLFLIHYLGWDKFISALLQKALRVTSLDVLVYFSSNKSAFAQISFSRMGYDLQMWL